MPRGTNYEIGDRVDAWHCGSWQPCQVMYRGPVPVLADVWPGFDTSDMLALRALPPWTGRALPGGTGAAWDLLVAADSDHVRPAADERRQRSARRHPTSVPTQVASEHRDA